MLVSPAKPECSAGVEGLSSVAEANAVLLNVVLEAPSNEPDKAEVLPKGAINIMTTVGIVLEEAVDSAGRIMTSRSETETLRSIFGPSGR